MLNIDWNETKKGVGICMWTSAELKNRAKMALSGNYWKSFGVALVVILLTGSGTSSGGTETYNEYQETDFVGIANAIDIGMILLFIGAIIVVLVLSIAFNILITQPIIVGSKRYFVDNSEKQEGDDIPFGILGYAFKEKRYAPIIKSMFLYRVRLLLWTLLFIIPRIIFGYAYAMVPYILSDNPEIGARRAIKLSSKMTDGEKMDMFILDLSFIGWFLLSIVTCGLGIFFMMPYYYATHAELYRILRDKALTQGLCTYEELGFAAPEPEHPHYE